MMAALGKAKSDTFAFIDTYNKNAHADNIFYLLRFIPNWPRKRSK
jgi:hypothetical protein